jgi:deaminated glutathione amidase
VKWCLVQMQSSADLTKNLAAMENAVRKAAAKGAELVAFPEMAYLSAPQAVSSLCVPQYHDFLAVFSSWAARYQIGLLPGSLREPGPGGKCFNTLPFFNSRGKCIAEYRKIFLFRANLPDRKYREAKHTAPGRNPVVFRFGKTRLGLAICYDLRFPELFRSLKKQGAEIVFIPSAFTVPTGKAHWEILLRARAIENQLTIAAPGLCQRSGNGALTYGHSMAIDPWGKILCQAEQKPSMLYFEYDSAQARAARSAVDAWSSRREDLFPIP